MSVRERPGADVVAAARAGDQRAVEALVTGYLPLIYNIVGRALDGHADVDDVVQETVLRVLQGLDGLDDPRRFRSWAVAIAMNQIRERWRTRTALPEAGALQDTPETADPGADFVDLTILELRLSGQRREVAEATRWLEHEERELLSLWWLETAGELTRAETTESLGLPGPHIAVRVQRMKARLDAARLVVRALRARPACEELTLLTAPWDGVPGALWRKRLARHVRECPRCHVQERELLPAEGLLAPLALLPLPVALAFRSWLPGAVGTTATATPSGATGAAPAGTAAFAAKPAALLAAGILAIGGGAALLYGAPWEDHERRAAPPAAAGPRGAASSSPSTTPSSASASPSPSPTPTPSVSASRTPAATPAAGAYGATVDAPDLAPDPAARPGPLPRRGERGVALSSFPGKTVVGGGYQIVHRGEWVTVRGQGYFTVRWDVMFAQRPGGLTMPTWTGLRGKLFHVASGGGYRMDDPKAGTTGTWMGNQRDGLIVLPPGAQQMWKNEYFHLDGEVTLHLNETEADYNLDILPLSWDAVSADLTTPPDGGQDAPRSRYGLVRDTGRDSAPVPQYLTRARPEDPLTVQRDSDLRRPLTGARAT
ncbi:MULTISPECIES: RNA polymerase sigma factor [unclassified Streptomyces]|uniref:RNA polymerase sigma factor n=1 Tax=unclassified Streptomyces TaxID=2593676 RepID=UPI0037F1449D